jgi:hypothetical protein
VILDILLCMSLVIFGLSLSLPGTNPWSLGVFWLLIIVEETWAWQSPAGVAARAYRLFLKRPGRPPRIGSKNNVSQQLTRSTTAEGRDELTGWMQLDFSPHQRTGNLHVAFCPPFAGTPELTFVQLDGPAARIKIAQLLPYGARLDVKLAAPSERSAAVLVQFTARTPGAGNASE